MPRESDAVPRGLALNTATADPAAAPSASASHNSWMLQGSFEANPPFHPALIDRMAAAMDAALARATRHRRPLSFIVIVPAWSEKKACARLERSPHLRRSLVAPNRRHEYTEGAQHRRPVGRLRRSTCDTAIYFLQSDEGAAAWPPLDARCAELLAALSGVELEAGDGAAREALLGGTSYDAAPKQVPPAAPSVDGVTRVRDRGGGGGLIGAKAKLRGRVAKKSRGGNRSLWQQWARTQGRGMWGLTARWARIRRNANGNERKST